jgi:hypothetical protein
MDKYVDTLGSVCGPVLILKLLLNSPLQGTLFGPSTLMVYFRVYPCILLTYTYEPHPFSPFACHHHEHFLEGMLDVDSQ